MAPSVEVVERAADPVHAEQVAFHDSRSVALSDIEEAQIRWLWKGFIPRGMVTILTGSEGLGKSQLALRIACAFTRGVFGDTSPRTGEPGGIVKYYSTEDSARHTIKPRAVANKAALEDFLVELHDAPTWLPDGLPSIEREVAELGVGLVVLDPVIGYFGSGDANKAQDVRKVLDGLARIADKYDAAIVGIMHPKKGEESSAIHKLIGGSSAFGQAARSVIGVAMHPDATDDRSLRVVGRVKGNLSKAPVPVAFEIVEHQYYNGRAEAENLITTSRVETLGEMPPDFVFETAILGSKQKDADGDEAPSRQNATSFLLEFDFSNEVQSSVVLAAAEERGISLSTMGRARSDAGIRTHKHGGINWWSSPIRTTTFVEDCSGVWR